MTALKEVIDNIICYNRSGEQLYNRVLVVSAFSGVTNLLLEDKKTGYPGVYHRIARHENFHEPLNELVARLKAINQQYTDLGLDLAVADARGLAAPAEDEEVRLLLGGCLHDPFGGVAADAHDRVDGRPFGHEVEDFLEQPARLAGARRLW